MRGRFEIGLCLGLCVLAPACSADPASAVTSSRPTAVIFHRETIYRPEGFGDGWCVTWAADDSQITSMDDGNWLARGHLFRDSQYEFWSAPQNKSEPVFHTTVYRILGGPAGFKRSALPNYPELKGNISWFGFGVISVDGVLYSAISKTPAADDWSVPLRGFKLLKSSDNGLSWQRVDRNGRERTVGATDSAQADFSPEEMFFFEESGLPHESKIAYPFSWVSFAQRGRDNSEATDEFIYIYSPEGAHSNRLLLARVEKSSLGLRSRWQYFVGLDGHSQPVWSSDLEKRGAVVVFPEKSHDGNFFGWISWLPSVVWNEGLGLYIMVNGGTYAGKGMTSSDADYYDSFPHTRTGSLGFWYSKTPYGQWHQFYYTDYWTADSPANRIYWPRLSPKWIGADGTEMVLIWSDAMADEQGRYWGVHYGWNQMRISIRLGN